LFFQLKKSIMKTFINKALAFVLVGIIVLSISFTSCETEEEPIPIDLPPISSLKIDLNEFPSNNTKSVELAAWNWLHASLTAFAWNAVLAVNVAIPVAAYVEAFNHAPVYLGDHSWEWSYSVIVGAETYETRLLGKRLDNETFSMEMNLSQLGGFQDFKWFEGEIRYDHTAATWMISHSPDIRTEYLEIAYEKDFALSLLSQEQDALYEVEEALKRIENNVYGICEMSGEQIPVERLKAIPFARYTVECQQKFEQENFARNRWDTNPQFMDSTDTFFEEDNDDDSSGNDSRSKD